MKMTQTEYDTLIAKPCKQIRNWKKKRNEAGFLAGCKTPYINELNILDVKAYFQNDIGKDNQRHEMSSL